jgi:hypothetical protein
MRMTQEQLEKMIGKMMNIIKPNGVSNMEFVLDFINKNEYYMGVTYIVPDGSEFLRSNNMRTSDDYRDKWNREIKNTIKNYFDVEVIINSSSIKSESYHERLKQY